VAERQQEAARVSRVPSYSLTVATFTGLLVFSFVMAAIHG
jgi:hypothetical protein